MFRDQDLCGGDVRTSVFQTFQWCWPTFRTIHLWFSYPSLDAAGEHHQGTFFSPPIKLSFTCLIYCKKEWNNFHESTGPFFGRDGFCIVRIWSLLYVKENVDLVVRCSQRFFNLLFFILLPLATKVDYNSPKSNSRSRFFTWSVTAWNFEMCVVSMNYLNEPPRLQKWNYVLGFSQELLKVIPHLI